MGLALSFDLLQGPAAVLGMMGAVLVAGQSILSILDMVYDTVTFIYPQNKPISPRSRRTQRPLTSILSAPDILNIP